MPVLVAIMMNSDILNDGQRSPRNYYEQLQRCTGLKPLNIFATINNRWTIGETAHESWEAEFFSDSIKNKAERFRLKLTEEGVAFTRAGCLLNLKLLLGTQVADVPFKETAIGAVALHANDYVESVETSGLAKDTLPAIAEFGPMWELQNIREPANLVARYFRLYQLLQQDDRMTALFKRPIGELTLAGLTFREYFTLLVGLFANARSGIMEYPKPTSIINARKVATDAHLTLEQFTTFAASKALTRDVALTAFGPLDLEQFVARVTTNAWTSDQRPFRRTPLLGLPRGDYLVLDLQFLFESASAGIPWALKDEYLTKDESRLFLNYWGTVFERYVQELLAHYYPSQAPVERKYGRDGQIDAFLIAGEDVIVVEVKAGFLAQEKKGSRDQQLVAAALGTKYVTDDGNRAVGVRQLAVTCNAVLDGVLGTIAGRIYPVLVGEEPMLQVPLVNTYLNDIFREHVTSDRIAPVTVMLVDELEQLLPNIVAGDLTWQDLITARCDGMRVAGAPVHTTLLDLAMKRRFRRRPDTFLRRHSDTLIAMVKEAYKDLK